MMHDSALHLTEDELNDAADGTSAPADGSRSARHLAHCARCRADVERIRSLLSMAAALPRSVEPPADLWPEIRTRIHGASSPKSGVTRRWNAMVIDRRWLAAAAVLLIVASSALTALFIRRDTDGFARGPDSAGPGVVTPVTRTVSDDYDRLDRELASMLAAQRDKLQPETVAKVEHNLAIIDQAIREIRDALAVDPGNDALLQLLKASYGQKSALVRQVSAS